MKISTFFKRILCAILITATLLLSCSCVNIDMQKSIALSLDEYTVNGAMIKYFYTKNYINLFAKYESLLTSHLFNPQAPLDEQLYTFDDSSDDKYQTWADFFTAQTTDCVKKVLLYCAESKALGITLDSEDNAKIDETVTSIINTITMNSSVDSSKEAIESLYGKGVREEDIRNAVRLEMLAEKTASAIEAGIDEKITDEKIESVYQENKQKYNVVNYFSFSFETDVYELIDEKYGDDKTLKELTASEEEEINASFEQAKAALKGYAEELANKTTLEEFKKYTLTYAASNSFDEEYKKENFEALSSQISATDIKEKMVEAVVKEVLEGNKAPADDVKNNTLYGIILNSNEAELANELKANIFRATYGENKYSSIENCRFTTTEEDDDYEYENWLFSSERKSGDIKAFEESDDECFSIDVMFLIDPPHRNESKPINYSYIFFDNESDAKNVIDLDYTFKASSSRQGTEEITKFVRNHFLSNDDIPYLSFYLTKLSPNSVKIQYDDNAFQVSTDITSFSISSGATVTTIDIRDIESEDFKQWSSTASAGSVFETVFKSDDGRYFIVVCEEKSEAPEWALQIKADLIEAEYTAYYTEMESGYSSNLIIDQEAIAKFCNNAAKKR